MVDRHALIDWPLTPYTGWGGYGIQLAQALLEQRQYSPRLLACNDRSAVCDLHWLDVLQYLENQSASLAQQLAAAEGANTLPVIGLRQLLVSLRLAICSCAAFYGCQTCGSDVF